MPKFTVTLYSSDESEEKEPRHNLLVGVRGKELESRARYIYVVADVSGSMVGTKIDLLRRTLHVLVNTAQSSDHLCLVTFNGHATKLFDGCISTCQTWDDIIDTQIRAAGTTNLQGGLMCAFDAYAKHQSKFPDYSHVLLAFTDGIVNLGLQDDKLIAWFKNILPWNMYGWVCALGFNADHNLVDRLVQTRDDLQSDHVQNTDLSEFSERVGQMLFNVSYAVPATIGEKFLHIMYDTEHFLWFTDKKDVYELKIPFECEVQYLKKTVHKDFIRLRELQDMLLLKLQHQLQTSPVEAFPTPEADVLRTEVENLQLGPENEHVRKRVLDVIFELEVPMLSLVDIGRQQSEVRRMMTGNDNNASQESGHQFRQFEHQLEHSS